jgi:adenylate kinase
MDKLVIMGPQGCGKGTQAHMLAESLDIVHISLGDMLRWHIEHHTKVGTRVRGYVAAGELVPDELVLDLMSRRLALHDWNYGFTLDGFPRNAAQTQFLLEGYQLDAAILLDVGEAVLLERLGGRRLCSGCGRDYNLVRHPPVDQDRCDTCGSRLVQRPDDAPEVARRRLRDYREKTRPVLDLFRKRARVLVVDGGRSPEEVQDEIRSGLGFPPLAPPQESVLSRLVDARH